MVRVVPSPDSQACKSWLFYDCSLLSPCRGSRNTSLSEMGDLQAGIWDEMHLIRQDSFPPSLESENGLKDFYHWQCVLNEKGLMCILLQHILQEMHMKAIAGSQSCLCSNCIIKARSPRGLTVSGFHKILLFHCTLEEIFVTFALITFLRKIPYHFSIVPDLAGFFSTEHGLESRHSF